MPLNLSRLEPERLYNEVEEILDQVGEQAIIEKSLFRINMVDQKTKNKRGEKNKYLLVDSRKERKNVGSKCVRIGSKEERKEVSSEYLGVDSENERAAVVNKYSRVGSKEKNSGVGVGSNLVQTSEKGENRDNHRKQIINLVVRKEIQRIIRKGEGQNLMNLLRKETLFKK